MIHTRSLPKSDQLARLDPQQIDEARHVIESMFETKTVAEIREDLRQWFEAALGSSHTISETGAERVSLFYLYNDMELLVEAAYVLNNQQKL